MTNPKGLKMAKVKEIFQDKTCLHLIIWNRFSEKSHTSGLVLVKKLIEDYELVMPMLRPIGRKHNGYGDGLKSDFEEPVPNFISKRIPPASILPGGYSAHCELFIQVADSVNNNLLDTIKPLLKQDNSLAAFLNHRNPIWGPLGESMPGCQYAVARDGLGTKILCDIGEEQMPAFLKLIWYRSSVVIAEWLSKQIRNSWIDPLSKRDAIYTLMSKTLADISPGEYGISSAYDSIDPSAFGVAHMAAFAINAITQVSHVYQMEQYFGNRNVTQPHSYPSREKFLKQFL